MHITRLGGRPSLPQHVAELASEVEARAPALRATEDLKGGLRRDDLLTALAPAVRGSGLAVHRRSSFAASEIDLVNTRDGVAVSVQAGRARSNNGALLAVLGAAAMDDVSWLIVLVPERYKGSVAAQPVIADFERLALARGIRLALEAVVSVVY